jgi:hypothetical protein
VNHFRRHTKTSGDVRSAGRYGVRTLPISGWLWPSTRIAAGVRQPCQTSTLGIARILKINSTEGEKPLEIGPSGGQCSRAHYLHRGSYDGQLLPATAKGDFQRKLRAGTTADQRLGRKASRAATVIAAQITGFGAGCVVVTQGRAEGRWEAEGGSPWRLILSLQRRREPGGGRAKLARSASTDCPFTPRLSLPGGRCCSR